MAKTLREHFKECRGCRLDENNDIILCDAATLIQEASQPEPPMTRERLSEEERKALDDAVHDFVHVGPECISCGLPKTLMQQQIQTVEIAVERIITERVTAARLVEAAAENGACENAFLDAYSRSLIEDGNYKVAVDKARKAIRSRMTPAHVSALDEMKRAIQEPLFREVNDLEMKLGSVGQDLDLTHQRLQQAEAEAKRLRVALECVRDRKDVVPLGIRTFVVDALSAPAVPDGD